MKKVLLNAKHIEEIAHKQSDIENDLQLIRNLIYYMPLTGSKAIDDQLELIHGKLQQTIKEINKTIFLLYNATDKKELESVGIKVDEEN